MPDPSSSLFTPLKIGSTTVKNRLMITSHSHDLYRFDPEGYNRWNMLSDRAVAYHAERAKGGWGLIITGQTLVHKSCGTGRPTGYLEEVVEPYSRIASAIHDNGAKCFMQMNHNGRVRTSGTDDWEPVMAASAGILVYPNAGGETCKEMETRDIKDVTDGFVKTARNMKSAGFDGVEIQSAHSYLLSEFLTPLYNKRKDEYGGSLENRMRFLMEVVGAVREEVGSQFVVGVRMNAFWGGPPDGWVPDEAIELAKRLEATRKVDFLDVTAWSYEDSLANTGTPFGPLVPYASQIKKAVTNTPVFVVGRIVDPKQAQEVISQGHADMVAMTRASIADPELPLKIQQDNFEDVRQCIGMSQGCLGRHMQLKPMTCTQNPVVGREAEWGIGKLKPAEKQKAVLIAGGGPAGMEAAIVSAQRGHSVTLCESSDTLGGQVKLILKNPRRGEFQKSIDWRIRQLGKLGVDTRLTSQVTPDLIQSINPDVVVVATGSQPTTESKFGAAYIWGPSLARTAGIPGSDMGHVYNPWDVLEGRLDDRCHVVLVDGVGYYQSSDPVEYLLTRNIKVTALSTAGYFAADMLYNDRPNFLQVASGKDVKFHNLAVLQEIGENFVRFRDHETNGDMLLHGVDAVVLSLGNVPNDALFHAVEGTVPELYRIGDCVTPRRVEHAHYEGHKLGREL
ncbi:FAD-dependent oxidoreductase [Dehalococcoidia bacterium]|nr:FAD-dependent oxidoreductase [Dehalococcoidia bacterium]